MKIKGFRVSTNKEWDTIVNNSYCSTYFHTRDWAEIWSSYTNNLLKPHPILITFEDDTHVLLPLSYTTFFKGLGKKYISSPAGTFGGWVSNNRLDKGHIESLINFLYSISDDLNVRINPYEETGANYIYKKAISDVTNTLKLDNDFEAIFRSWTKGHKSAVPKAVKAGIIIEKGKNLDDWKAYYEVYQDSIKRWGEKASSNYKWTLFEEFYKRKSDNITLWLAKHENRIIAGALCFYCNKHIVYWHGAALDEFFNLRPVNLLMYETIKDGCQRGYKWFDFNPSGGHEGVKSFKKSFGTIELNCPVVSHKNLKYSVLNFANNKLNFLKTTLHLGSKK
ncbi:MAG TPA: GNAT family N-acetyltransferase [Cytophagales bacterium]|nr:GNAT family N-acetyltransferase [Cytophagales bacterium]